MNPRAVIFAAAVIPAMLGQRQSARPEANIPEVVVVGTVVDKDSHAAVPGASVSVSGFYDNDSATSGGSGEFQFRLATTGPLTVSVRAAGYQRQEVRVAIATGQESVRVDLPIAKLQSIVGTVVDDETRKPIPGLQVSAVDPHGNSVTSAPTGPDGSFFLRDLPQGEYFLRIADKPEASIQSIPAKALEGVGRDKALKVPEGASSYGTIVWPGKNADIPMIPGIQVGNAPADFGEIRLTKTKLQNLSGTIAPCEEGASLQLSFSRPVTDAGSPTWQGRRDITCGDGFQILNIPDGTFTLSAVQGFPQRRWASQKIDAHTHGPLQLNLAPLVKVQISLAVEDGKTDDLPPNLRVVLYCDDRSLKIDAPAMLGPGEFEALLYPGERYTVGAPYGTKYFLKRLAYNGAELQDLSGFAASGAALSHLEMVLSPHGATVNVRIPRSATDAPVTMRLVRDGMSFGEFRTGTFPQVVHVEPNESTHIFAGLHPGTYRAIRDSENPPKDEASFRAMLADVSVQSSPVTVDEGQTATITWDLP